MLDHKAIGQRIRFRRLELDLSQEDLAELAGVSTSFIGHIEHAEKSATLDTFDTIIGLVHQIKMETLTGFRVSKKYGE